MKVVWPFYESEWANFSSPHELGQNLTWTISRSYDAIQKALDMPQASSCVITSSGAEATSQGIRSLLRHGLYEHGKNHVAIARFHDAATTMAVDAERENDAASVTYIQANKLGVLTKDSILDAITPRTAFIAFPLVHPLLGTIQPIEEIYEVAKMRSIPLLVDISNAIGTVMVDMSEYDSIYYTVRGEALGLPRGLGGLLARTPSAPPFSPIIYGDEHPGLCRGGPLNVAGLVGLAEALEAAKRRDIMYCTEVSRIKRLFEDSLIRAIGKDSLYLPFQENDAVAPHISCLIFKGVKNEAMLYHLNKKKVYATIGGAGFQNIVDVLEGMQFEATDAFSALSFCFSYETREAEALEAVERISSIYRVLRKISPYILPEG